MSKAKRSTLTDLQLLILSKASQRNDHAIELPPNLKGGAAAKVVKKLIDGGLVEEIASAPGFPVWRRDDAGQPFALIITHSAFEALGIEPDVGTDTSPAVPSTDKEGRKGRRKGTRARSRSKAKVPAQTHPDAPPRSGTKQALIITLLQRQQGATIDDLMEATQWLPHTTRAALTGLRKRGYEVAKGKGEDGKTVYRIDSEAEPSKVPATGISSKAA
jgi:hypothetical protein